SSCRPLSTPPMRRPSPPARITPVTGQGRGARGEGRGTLDAVNGRATFLLEPRTRTSSLGFSEPVFAGEEQIMLPGGPADHREADLVRDFVAHMRESRARYQNRNAHLRALDHHFRSEPPGGIEHLVAAVDAVQPHLPGNR